MSFDSLIRLRQLNNPELSGYILEVVGKIATGLQLTGSGVLTGVFYPRYQNPSGYVTGLATGDFVTNTSLAVSESNLLALTSGLFYLKSNPSGFVPKSVTDANYVRVYPFPNSGVEWVDDPSSTTVFSFVEGSHFYIQSNQGKSIFDVSGTIFGAPTLSGVNIESSSIKVNGQNVVTETGDFISKVNDGNNTRLYLYDNVIVDDPFAFKRNELFWLKGYNGKAIIDLFDSTRGGIDPYISGFEIRADKIYISGIPLSSIGGSTTVITGSGATLIVTGTGISYPQLTGVSGALYSQIETVRTNLVLTGQKIGPPITSPRIFYLTKDYASYSGKLYTAFSGISPLIAYITGNGIRDSLIYVGTGDFGSKAIVNASGGFGNLIFYGLYNYPVSQQMSLSFTNSSGNIYTANGTHIHYLMNAGALINHKNYHGYSEALVDFSQSGTGYFDGIEKLYVQSSSVSGYLKVSNSKILSITNLERYKTFIAEGCTVNGISSSASLVNNTRLTFTNCIISGATQLPKNSGKMPILMFDAGGKSYPYHPTFYSGGGALGYDGRDLWLSKTDPTGLTTELLLTKASGDAFYYGVGNPNSYVTQNFVATFYALDANVAYIGSNATHNTSFRLYDPFTTPSTALLFDPDALTFYLKNHDASALIDVYGNQPATKWSGPSVSGFNIDAPNLYVRGIGDFRGELYANQTFGIVNNALAEAYFYFDTGADPTEYYLQNTGKTCKIDFENCTISGFSIALSSSGITDAENIGIGYGLVSGITFNTIQVKSLIGGTGIYITQSDSSLTISVTGISTSGGGSSTLGDPTDGTYGGVNGAIAGVANGDRTEDAFDKVEVILGKLAPSKPQNLSAATISFSNTTYSALEQGTATSHSPVMNSFKPTGFATGFYDADAGILSAYVNGNITGQKTLSTGSDIGTYTGLNIYQDADYWSGVVGKAGFWSYLNARVSPTGTLSSGIFTVRLSHSTAGSTSTLTGWCDAPITPTALVTNVNTGACTTRIIDGVKSLATSDPITVSFRLTNAVSAFYSSTIANVSSSQTSSANVSSTGTPFSGTLLNLSGAVTVSTNKYITGWVPSVYGYNSAGGVSSTVTSGTSIRIDTVSTQPTERRKAGSGRYPDVYGNSYDNNDLLTANEELQLINGSIQYPSSINYNSIIPSGPDYSNINTGSFITGGSGYRWANFNLGTITTDSSITITFNSTSNFGSSVIISPGFLFYVKVSGATPTNGWVDGNAAYPGVGNPTNTGDPALVVGSSSATVKVLTFGTAALDGTVWARIGLPSGSNKSFGSLTLT